MRKNRIWIIISITFFLLTISSCKKKSYCEKNGHAYSDATCTNESKCTICGIKGNDALGHNFTEATCINASTCKRCGIKGNDALGHSFTEATCINASTCKRCGLKSGDTIEHNWVESSYDEPKTCSICGTIELNAKLYINCLSVGSSTNLFIDGYYDLANLNVFIENTNIISINEFGKITALNKGNTTFSISTKDGKSNTLTFTIDVISKIPEIFVTYERLAIGDSTKIFFKNLNELDESSLEDFNISFKNNDILKLNDDLSFTALKLGEEIVTLTSKLDERVTKSITIKVVDENAELLIYGKEAINSLQAGDRFYMIPTLSYENENLVWLSSNKEVAAVSADGLVSIINEGYVTINAYDPKNYTIKANYSFFIEGIMNIDYVSRLIHTALEENGTKELNDNEQKYGEWYGNNGQPWCAMFVSWCWNRSGLSTDILLKYQGCYTGLKWCTEQGIMHYVQDYKWQEPLLNGASQNQYAEDYKPVSGDIVFFLHDMSHTGIVIYSDDTYLYTIEGNTSNQVAVKRWDLNSKYITGYAHPNYPIYEGTPEDFSWIKELQPNGKYIWSNAGEKPEVI